MALPITVCVVLGALIVAARPRQWVKNAFVAAPIVFAKRLDDMVDIKRALMATAIFCAVSSAVYLWNDVVDVEKDRKHPTKCRRPIASGRLSISQATTASGVLAVAALGLGYLLSPWFALTALSYLVVNLAYSFRLKRVVFVDVFSIATGFLLRVLAGSLAIGVTASPYLFLCTALLASFLGFGKRAHELSGSRDKAKEARPVLAGYTPASLRLALVCTGFATLVSYTLYTVAEHTRIFFQTNWMWATCPFAAFGLYRFGRLIYAERAESPTETMLTDAPFLINLALWVIAIVGIIYRPIR